MARKNSPSILQEELYPPPGERSREEMDDARMLDLDVEQKSPFLRGQKRVLVRRGPFEKTVSWISVDDCRRLHTSQLRHCLLRLLQLQQTFLAFSH